MPQRHALVAFATAWLALARRNPRLVRAVWGAALLLVAANGWLLAKRTAYARETTRLRAGMSAVERARLDAALESDSNRLQVMIELARRQARGDAGLHLTVVVDSGMLYLEQERATLRAVHAEVAPDTWVRTGPRDSLRITAPRGTRTIERVLDDSAVVLNGGTTIYARAAHDASSAVRPGSVRVEAADLKVLRPNLKPGLRVYFY